MQASQRRLFSMIRIKKGDPPVHTVLTNAHWEQIPQAVQLLPNISIGRCHIVTKYLDPSLLDRLLLGLMWLMIFLSIFLATCDRSVVATQCPTLCAACCAA